MANVFHNEAKESLIDGGIVLATDTIKLGLANATYSPNADDQFVDDGDTSDLESNRLTGTTDQTLGTKATGKDLTGDFAYFDAADPTFTAVTAGQTAAWGVVYKDTGVATTSRVIVSLDIPDTATNGGDITIQFATPANGGVFRLT